MYRAPRVCNLEPDRKDHHPATTTRCTEEMMETNIQNIKLGVQKSHTTALVQNMLTLVAWCPQHQRHA